MVEAARSLVKKPLQDLRACMTNGTKMNMDVHITKTKRKKKKIVQDVLCC